MVTIPKCMSTQHPDNVNLPFFAESAQLGGEDEIQEAYYVFSHLGCDEQMWDCEGKEVDDFVVRKLLTNYAQFFQETRLGTDVFITLRVPNPAVEKAESKVLLETLESIPRSFDASKLFYGDDVPPIFEVILPMTTDYKSIDRIFRYYADFIVARQRQPVSSGDITIGEWIGEFKPEHINVIPLFEDSDNMLAAHTIVKNYLEDKPLEYQRVFLARSDPAMNYGLVGAVVLNKIALMNLHALSEDSGVPLYPIIGVGSAPFRGNLRPQTVERVMQEYPSAHTFTIQSAFKYDNAPDDVKDALNKLRQRKPSPPHIIDEARCLALVEKYRRVYQQHIRKLAPTINHVAQYIPSRRKRKLHTDLFGYSRSVDGITLPRAIRFTASLYSIGLPPELLGLSALNDADVACVTDVHVNFEQDIRDALRYYNPDTGFVPEALKTALKQFSFDVEIDEKHRELTDTIADAVRKNKSDRLGQAILSAANLRKFLG